MIQAVYLHNFKCFQDETISFAPLTLLTGVNGMGKSSVIQALLALQQTDFEAAIDDALSLNGDLVHLGLPGDVVNEHAEESLLTIGLQTDSGTNHYSYTYSSDDRDTLLSTKGCCSDSPFTHLFHYLNAERMGPRTSFPIPTMMQSIRNRIGNSGEFAAYNLSEYGSLAVPCEKLLLPPMGGGTPLRDALSQTEAWLSRIGHPVRIHVQEYPGMDLVNLEFSFISHGLPTKKYRATNVGFGLTYALPVFVAVLLAEPGDLVLIENPEAHLHPKGQSVMGRFLATAASAGIQVVVETHSDHLLNGVRLAVKQEILDPADAAIHFFTQDEQKARVHTPRLDKDGRLDQWPEDFFDEWEKNLAELL